MIDLVKIEGIYLYGGPTDLRLSLNGLLIKIQENFIISDMENKLFIFCNKEKTRIKAIEKDDNGFWLYYKRVSEGKFKWPKSENNEIMIDKRQLLWLLEGLEIYQKKAFQKTDFKHTY